MVTTELNGDLPRSIGFLLIPGFSMLALFAAVEPLRLANQLLGQRYYCWRIFTSDGRPAQASCGMAVPADAKAAPESSEKICHASSWSRASTRGHSSTGGSRAGSGAWIATALLWER